MIIQGVLIWGHYFFFAAKKTSFVKLKMKLIRQMVFGLLSGVL